jgi:HAD superfamily hydrolase (TIGR01509 family)
MSDPIRAVLLDVDGTLVDSNDAHATAWVRAFAEDGIDVDLPTVRRAIGMGGDHLMPHVSGIADDSSQGRRIAARRGEIFSQELLSAIAAFPDADRLIHTLKDRGLTLVAASSAKEDELEKLLARAGVDGALDRKTSSDDAESSKPEPDIILAALARAHVPAAAAIMIGDTPYDVEAALRAGIEIIGLRSGGWSDAELHGAVAVYQDPADLLEHYDLSPFKRRVPAPSA